MIIINYEVKNIKNGTRIQKKKNNISIEKCASNTLAKPCDFYCFLSRCLPRGSSVFRQKRNPRHPMRQGFPVSLEEHARFKGWNIMWLLFEGR